MTQKEILLQKKVEEMKLSEAIHYISTVFNEADYRVIRGDRLSLIIKYIEKKGISIKVKEM